jgi:glycosyltransferase involved in cell wall biosynthesis
MKILRVLPAMDFGGIERGVYDFSLKATELGNEAVIVSEDGRFIDTLKKKGIKHYNVPLNKKSITCFLKNSEKIKDIIEEEKPDLIHTQSRYPCWVMSYVMKSFPKTPWVTSIHSFNPVRIYSKSEGFGNKVIVVSNALKNYAVDYLKVDERKIKVIYNGISDKFTKIIKERKTSVCIGMVSRFAIYKGHFIFLEAIKQVIDKSSLDINVLIVGTGNSSYKSKLEEWIKNNGVQNIVRIVREDSVEALKKIDILVVPSFIPEGFGRTVVEAQLSRTPVIGTNIGALPELIEDGKTGFLVDPKNSQQISEKIEYIIKNPDIREEIIENALNNALENFTLSKMVEKTIQVYQELL